MEFCQSKFLSKTNYNFFFAWLLKWNVLSRKIIVTAFNVIKTFSKQFILRKVTKTRSVILDVALEAYEKLEMFRVFASLRRISAHSFPVSMAPYVNHKV